jgi:hypothetical protein
MSYPIAQKSTLNDKIRLEDFANVQIFSDNSKF